MSIKKIKNVKLNSNKNDINVINYYVGFYNTSIVFAFQISVIPISNAPFTPSGAEWVSEKLER